MRLKLFRSHFKFQPVTVLGIVIAVHGLAQLSSKRVTLLFLLLDNNQQTEKKILFKIAFLRP